MNISNIHQCYGCGVCSIVCHRNIIQIKLNQNGFYEPQITDIDRCNDCGLCYDICSYHQNELSLKSTFLQTFGGWSNDVKVRRHCSSGGIGFELGKYLLTQGYKVCAVKYNPDANRAEHYIASSLEELIPSIGSKYIQSYTVDGFKDINRKEKYFVTGAPCQIDSFRRYIQKFHCEDNFILMDFFCHGVPSKLMWDKYVKWAETKVGKLTYVSWRNKFTGWHDSYNLLIKEGESYLNTRLSQGDMFYNLFLSDVCLGKACYDKCKYKYDKSSADIRIGDAWGRCYENDEKGVNSVLCFTQKGIDILKSSNCHLEERPLKVIAEAQLKSNVKYLKSYDKVILALKDRDKTIEEVYRIALPTIRRNHLISRLSHPVRSFRNIIKKLEKWI